MTTHTPHPDKLRVIVVGGVAVLESVLALSHRAEPPGARTEALHALADAQLVNWLLRRAAEIGGRFDVGVEGHLALRAVRLGCMRPCELRNVADRVLVDHPPPPFPGLQWLKAGGTSMTTSE